MVVFSTTFFPLRGDLTRCLLFRGVRAPTGFVALSECSSVLVLSRLSVIFCSISVRLVRLEFELLYARSRSSSPCGWILSWVTRLFPANDDDPVLFDVAVLDDFGDAAPDDRGDVGEPGFSGAGDFFFSQSGNLNTTSLSTARLDGGENTRLPGNSALSELLEDTSLAVVPPNSCGLSKDSNRCCRVGTQLEQRCIGELFSSSLFVIPSYRKGILFLVGLGDVIPPSPVISDTLPENEPTLYNCCCCGGGFAVVLSSLLGSASVYVLEKCRLVFCGGTAASAVVCRPSVLSTLCALLLFGDVTCILSDEVRLRPSATGSRPLPRRL
mmetsp:Transcript_9058/g.14733  ORF Transcript_9058/g.14733 Transcript_9058/m.14733 type:complete len:326 (-) Transcript_9058:1113-2090(-)